MSPVPVRAALLLVGLTALVGCDLVSGLTDFEIRKAPSSTGGAAGSGGAGGGPGGNGGAGGTEPLPPCVAALDARKHTTCAVLRNNTLWCWGAFGGFPSGSVAPTNTPTNANLSEVAQVAVGADFIVALSTDGQVRTWGENAFGQLGNGETGPRQVSAQDVLINGTVVQIAAGRHHACALTDSGSVWCWGWNEEGQVAQDPGNVLNQTSPIQVPGVAATKIALGGRFSCAIRDIQNDVTCWGRNLEGQLGRPATAFEFTPAAFSESAEELALGGRHGCAVFNGGVRCWGWNGHWQLGNGAGANTHIPQDVAAIGGTADGVSVAGRRSCARLTTGDVSCWGELGQALPMGASVMPGLPTANAELQGARLIALASYHLCAVRPDGMVWCAGRGDEGQLGNGDNAFSAELQQVQLDCPQ